MTLFLGSRQTWQSIWWTRKSIWWTRKAIGRRDFKLWKSLSKWESSQCGFNFELLYIQVEAHRMVLALVSPVLRALLYNDQPPSSITLVGLLPPSNQGSLIGVPIYPFLSRSAAQVPWQHYWLISMEDKWNGPGLHPQNGIRYLFGKLEGTCMNL